MRENCMVCGQPKAELTKKKSEVMPDFEFNTCALCAEKKWEPRYIIIMAARSYGIKQVTKQIRDKLYAGEPIIGSDLVV